MELSCPRCHSRYTVPSSRAGLIHCPSCASPFVTPPPPLGGPGRRSSLLLLAQSDPTADQLRRTIRLWGSTARPLIVVVAVAWIAFLCVWAILDGGEWVR